jgi:serine/threonine protein phosphatase PrpC
VRQVFSFLNFFLEIVETHIDSGARFIVLASDGVFEVFNNVQVEGYLVPFCSEGKQDLSATVLVEKAAAQWKKESDGQDDITAIVAFFE